MLTSGGLVALVTTAWVGVHTGGAKGQLAVVGWLGLYWVVGMSWLVVGCRVCALVAAVGEDDEGACSRTAVQGIATYGHDQSFHILGTHTRRWATAV